MTAPANIRLAHCTDDTSCSVKNERSVNIQKFVYVL